jgi:CheY-like chemotaxis protein
MFNWKDKTILIAEDEDINYFYLSELLESTEINLIHAKNGKEALEKVATESAIDLILMDIRMPVMNGYEATKEIKKMKSIPVIAQTAFAFTEDKDKALSAGCDDYLAKPITRQSLYEVLNNHFRK